MARFALPCGIRKLRAKPALDLDDVAELAEVGDFLQQDDLHRDAPQCTIGVRQQRQEPRALDRGRQLALVARLGAGDARRHDLAVLVDEILQELDVLVVDLLDAFSAVKRQNLRRLNSAPNRARSCPCPCFLWPLPLPSRLCSIIAMVVSFYSISNRLMCNMTLRCSCGLALQEILLTVDLLLRRAARPSASPASPTASSVDLALRPAAARRPRLCVEACSSLKRQAGCRRACGAAASRSTTSCRSVTLRFSLHLGRVPVPARAARRRQCCGRGLRGVSVVVSERDFSSFIIGDGVGHGSFM